MKDLEIKDDEVKMVSIPADEYNTLLLDQEFLRALQGAGVDNWEGYDIALDSVVPMDPDLK